MSPTLLLTRPRESAEDFARNAHWSGKVVVSPVLRVVLRDIVPPAPGCELVVTSQHAIRALAASTSRRDWPLWCVGPGSAAAARRAGFADLRAGGGTADTLLSRILAARPEAELVHLRGVHVTGDLVGRLNAAGLRARALVCYEQVDAPLTEDALGCLSMPGDVVIPVFSPRSAMLVAQARRALPGARARLHAVAISAAAANELQGLPLATCAIARTPDRPGMLDALARVQAMLEPDKNPL